MVIDQVVATLHKDTAAAIAAYDRGHDHMLMVADVLSSGIVKQFPERFER
jgi:putative heme iron utilization protein